MDNEGYEFQDKVLRSSGFIASDGQTNHPDPRMHWKISDMNKREPIGFPRPFIELVYGRSKLLQKD